MRIYKFTRRYHRDAERREVEVDNKVVFLRGFGPEEQLRAFHHFEELDQFLAQTEQELLQQGFKIQEEERPAAGYTHLQAQAHYRKVAKALGFSQQEIAGVIESVQRYSSTLAYVRALFRATEGARDELMGRGGMLWTLCFAGEDEEVAHYDPSSWADDEVQFLLEDGLVFAVADAEAWIDVGGDVYYVHPEETNGPYPAREFMEEQVEAALEGAD